MATRGINKSTIVGNMGADQEVRYMPSGTPVATISVATTDEWTDRESGEPCSRTDWHRIIFHARLAEVVAEYTKKGSQVYVEGANRTDKFQDKQTGEDRFSHYIKGNVLRLLDRKPDNASEHATADESPDQETAGEGALAEA